MEKDREPAVVACSLGRADLGRRRERWHALGARAGHAVERTDRGLRLTFRADAGVERELEELVALERECCAFADWSVGSEGDRVVLAVSGDGDEAVAAVQAMFDGGAGQSTQLAGAGGH